MSERLLTTNEAAALLQIHPTTLRRLNRNGNGPPVVRIGGSVRYRSDDLNAWIAERTGKSSFDGPQA